MTSLVVAVGRGGAIGADGRLPWHAPEDLAHFRAVTMGHTLVLGRVTWESIGRPLPGRSMVVVSRGGIDVPAGVRVAADPDAALDLASADDPDPCVVGGAQVYAALEPRVDVAHLTEVDVEVPDADAFFRLDPSRWREVERRAGDDPRLTFVRYVRTPAP